jgi:hypothetical protein
MSKVSRYIRKSIWGGAAVASFVYVILEARLFSTRPADWVLLIDPRTIYVAVIFGLVTGIVSFLLGLAGASYKEKAELVTVTDPTEWLPRIRGAAWLGMVGTVSIFIWWQLLSLLLNPADWSLFDRRVLSATLLCGLVLTVAGFFRMSKEERDS